MFVLIGMFSCSIIEKSYDWTCVDYIGTQQVRTYWYSNKTDKEIKVIEKTENRMLNYQYMDQYTALLENVKNYPTLYSLSDTIKYDIHKWIITEKVCFHK